jgi:hypothetical protein
LTAFSFAYQQGGDSMIHKRLFILALITVISIFMAYQVFALRVPEPSILLAAIPGDDYWRGTTDTNIVQIKDDIREIKMSVKDICADITRVQVQAARDGAIWGGGGGLGIYLLGLLVQALKKKDKGGGK